MSVEALSGKVFLVVTGASRGIGRQIALTFGSLLEKGSHMLLLARDLNALCEVKKSIPPIVNVDAVRMDLSKATKTDLEEAILKTLKGTTREAFDRVVLVHNVGSLVAKLLNELTDLNDWRTYYDLNFFVPAVLNAVVMNLFDSKTNTKKVFASENPDVDVLSYGPGAVDTDMFTFLCENVLDPVHKEHLRELWKNKIVISPEQSINHLVEVLKAHKYKPAEHVDYYDPL
ncbi:sepiapterin reductase isoform X2 [Ooceraea biroi]|uniref:sepiapterin reductase isoform X2 n=1 Tax=Ooceraea biroi TaxID=2015173 RepID=UPI000F092B65|nr:sepiapterin reductase isoform X2 [Ooceraea biroi]